MTDLPLSRLSHAQREQLWANRQGRESELKLKARDRMRKRRLLEHQNAMDRPVKLPPTCVLQDWFVDEHGCRARRVGCEGDGG